MLLTSAPRARILLQRFKQTALLPGARRLAAQYDICDLLETLNEQEERTETFFKHFMAFYLKYYELARTTNAQIRRARLVLCNR